MTTLEPSDIPMQTPVSPVVGDEASIRTTPSPEIVPPRKTGLRFVNLLGFGVASVPAVTQEWSLQEFCWSTWLAGLCYAWSCVAVSVLSVILTARIEKEEYEKRFPFLRAISPSLFLFFMLPVVSIVGWVGYTFYSYLFAFYGVFLSVFAEMEPHSFFGRNGFINSDFFAPVVYLFERFWPMVLGTLIAKIGTFSEGNPWKRMAAPLVSEIVRLHVFILALPFFSLFAWFLFGDAYQSATLVLLMGLFYFLPSNGPKRVEPI